MPRPSIETSDTRPVKKRSIITGFVEVTALAIHHPAPNAAATKAANTRVVLHCRNRRPVTRGAAPTPPCLDPRAICLLSGQLTPVVGLTAEWVVPIHTSSESEVVGRIRRAVDKIVRCGSFVPVLGGFFAVPDAAKLSRIAS